jgi:hypothetical protein
MFLIFVTSFLLFQVFTTAENICDKIPTTNCGQDDLTFEMPNDGQEFDSVCSGYVKYVECLRTYEKTCPDGLYILFFTSGDSLMMYSLVEEICQNNTKLHSELMDHMACIKKVTKSKVDDCTSMGNLKSDEYLEFLKKEINNGGLDLETVMADYFVLPPCLRLSYTTSCTLLQIENNCGSSASRITMEMLQRSTFLLQACKDEDLTKLRKGFVDFLKSSDESLVFQEIINSPEFFKVLKQIDEWYDEE